MKIDYYKTLRFLLRGPFRFWYRPTVVGKENIPKDGRCIIVGNHIHVLDQCSVIISTKRKISFMAKMEYFQGKTAWFFKKTGCIPVDRSKKDNNATSQALEVLKKDQALSLFPEGTRNRLKAEKIKAIYKKYKIEEEEEVFQEKMKETATSQFQFLEELLEKDVIQKEDLIDHIYDVDSYLKELVKKKKIKEDDYYDSCFLPFKYGAVSMANKTNSVLIPYVVSGHYKFRTKDLIVSIGKPIKPQKDLEMVNKRLRKEMIKLLKENLKMSEK